MIKKNIYAKIDVMDGYFKENFELLIKCLNRKAKMAKDLLKTEIIVKDNIIGILKVAIV